MVGQPGKNGGDRGGLVGRAGLESPPSPRFSAKAIRANKTVETYRGGVPVRQTHRGWTGLVYVPGHRDAFRTYTFHQKQRAAQAAAEKYGRWLVKDPANVEQAIEWRKQRKGTAL